MAHASWVCRVVLAGLVLLLPSWGHAQSQTVTVGSGTGCTSATLAGALASLPRLGPSVVHRVRVSSGSAITGGATLDRISARIEGGYANCAATTPQPGAISRITGPAAVPLLRVRNVAESAATYRVELAGLELRDGDAGAVEVEGRVLLRLDRVELVNNEAAQGAGLRVIGGPSGWTQRAVVEFGAGVVLNANSAVGGDGGGLHCSGGAVLRVPADAGLAVINNVATARGGGLYLSACDLVMAAPVAGGGATRPLRVAANRATAGGGAAVVDGSWVGEGAGHAALEIDTNVAGAAGIGDGGGLLLDRAVLIAASPVHITGNQAGGLGGGAWLQSGSIDQRGTELVVAGNVAVVGSGGLHAQGMSLLTTASTQACRGPCVRLDDNEVTGTGINQGAGAALQLLDQTTVAWDRIRIRGNRSRLAPVLFARGAAPFGVSVEWWNAAIVGNAGDLVSGFEGAPIVLGSGGVRLNIALSTIAANQAMFSGNGIPQLLRAFDGAAIGLRGVIVDQPAWVTVGQGVGAQVSLTGACVYSREVASLQARGLPAVAADPRIELGGDGVRLRADSPAIDACRQDALLVPGAALGQAPLAQDYAGRWRPERVRAGANDSPYDAGADEYVERIFGAGFEAGND